MMARLFIAAPLSEETRNEIERVVNPLRIASPSASWSRPEAYHVTFAFLGEQDQSVIEPLAAELTKRLQWVRSFDLVATQCGFFPNARRPRVGWIGLSPESALNGIAEHVRDALVAQKIEFDSKPFVAHLTLARLQDGWSAGDVENFSRSLDGFATSPQPLTEVSIYSSKLSPKGAIHTPLKTFKLP
jgi:2'-5' RNA ligase